MSEKISNVVTSDEVEPQTFPKFYEDKVIIKWKLNKPVLPEFGVIGETMRDNTLCIGSSFSSPTSRVLLGRTILTKEQEELWMSKIVGVHPNHQDWNKILDEYWANLWVKIPYEGRVLDASYNEVKARVIEPVNIEDYILYLYCLKYPQVANTMEIANSSSRIRFYLIRETEIARAAEQKRLIKDKAIKLRFSIQDDIVAVKAILVLGGNLVNRTEANALHALADFSENHPAEFMKIAGDKKLLEKAMVESAIRINFFTRPVNSSIILFEGAQIAKNLEEAVIWLNLPENSETLLVLKDKLSVQ